jgi:tRNA A37 threonylcarbamoyladenosine synthetase subunit TsaC/SUA5/YrdC
MPELTRLDPGRAEDRKRLAAWLAAGRIAALPTETVPGIATLIGADGAAAAARRLNVLKGAPLDKPAALHLPDLEALRRLTPSLPPGLPQWLSARLPGAWTVLLPARWINLPAALGWVWPQVGIRIPRSPAFEACARAAGGPLLLSSINQHGEPPLSGSDLTEWLAAREIPLTFDPAHSGSGQPSRIVSFDPTPRLLRGAATPAELRPGLRVLVVCSGNICRSPLAGAILRQELAAAWGVREKELHSLGWMVESAGSFAQPGADASEHSVTAGREIGVDLSSHRARTLPQALAGNAWDLVLGMGRNHLASLAALGIQGELFDPSEAEVPDPFGADLAAYRKVREHLQRAAQDRVEAFSRWQQPALTAGRRGV